MADTPDYKTTPATGPKPGDRHVTFFESDMADHLLRAMVTLTMELSVTRERLDSMERVLQNAKAMSDDDIEQLSLSLEDEQARAAARTKLVQDIFGPFAQKFASL